MSNQCLNCNSKNVHLLSKFSKEDGSNFICKDCNFQTIKIPLESGHIEHINRCINFGRILYEHGYHLSEGELYYLKESINPKFNSSNDRKILEILLQKYKEDLDRGSINLTDLTNLSPQSQAQIFISFPLNTKIAPNISHGASDLS